MNKNLIEKSKILSFVLRHNPESIGLTIHEDTWAQFSDLLDLLNKNGHEISRTDIKNIVGNDIKHRFEFSKDDVYIRAAYGHSFDKATIQRIAEVPPHQLFHGTAKRFLDSIKENGLHAKERHYVHLIESVAHALENGKRYGSPVVLKIDSDAMHRAGFAFFKATDGIWLTNSVPVDYILIETTPDIFKD